MKMACSGLCRYFGLHKITIINGKNILNNRLFSELLSLKWDSCEIIRKTSTGPLDKFNHLKSGPDLKDFMKVTGGKETATVLTALEPVPYLQTNACHGLNRKVYFDVYGCQMNVSDTEIVWSILKAAGFKKTNNILEADVILMMTCAIRDSAEVKIWNKLEHYRGLKRRRGENKDKSKPNLKIGILGCMAERLKYQLVEKERCIDIVAGPDCYKDLPNLLAVTNNNETAINVILSHDETYADVVPVRLNEDNVSAFVSIMRGCDNMCTYCIVPFTRGRERSRPIESILKEVQELSSQGIKEVTLLGQNVNSYRDVSVDTCKETVTSMAEGFKTVYKPKKGGLRFAELLDQVAAINPDMRIRFTSPHPKDFPDEVLGVIRSRHNVCCNLHLPAQSGSNKVLERMRRGYTREAYMKLVDKVRSALPSVTISSDFICGFCGETDAEFSETLTLLEDVGYHVAYLFAYSMREKTAAHRRFQDDVPRKVKQERLKEMVSVYRKGAERLHAEVIGQKQVILIEGESKRSKEFLFGRNDGNVKVIVPAADIPVQEDSKNLLSIKAGDYVNVKITNSNSQLLKGLPLHHATLSGHLN